MTTKSTDPRVLAIRDDKRVGRGSCSSIDECYDDIDILKQLDALGVKDAKGAVKWALQSEGLWREQGLNQRWGEDDDPQLQSYREWNGLDTSFNDKKSEQDDDDEPPHRRGCVCADCSGAELTSDND